MNNTISSKRLYFADRQGNVIEQDFSLNRNGVTLWFDDQVIGTVKRVIAELERQGYYYVRCQFV